MARPACAHPHEPLPAVCTAHDHDEGGHGHAHSHAHGLGGSGAYREKERRALKIVLGITLFMMGAEFVGGYLSNSLALTSDAVHMLTDATATIIALSAFRLALAPADRKRTFGSYRAEVLGALANGIFLLMLAGVLFYAAFGRLNDPQDVQAGRMLFIASLGLGVNLASVFVMARVSRENLNVKGAFYHILGDTVSSVAVVAGAVAIHFTGWTRLDPILSIAIACMIVVWALTVVRDAARILLEAVPDNIKVDRIEARLRKIDGVANVHDVHVWSITTGFLNLSAHIVVPDMRVHDTHRIRQDICRVLREEFDIGHTTIQFECKCIAR